MGSANSHPRQSAGADELDKLGQDFIEDLKQAKNAQDQVRAPLDYMCRMQRPCMELLADMNRTLKNVPEEARQDVTDCIRDFDKLLKDTMNHCVTLKDIVDEQNHAISNMKKLKRLANEHGRAVVGNPTFRTFAEKARSNVRSSSQKTDAAHPVTDDLIKRYGALGRRFEAVQKQLAANAAHYQKMKWVFVGLASALVVATIVCIVLAVVLPPAGVAAGAAGAAAISTAEAGAIAGLSGGAIACIAVASTAGAIAVGCTAGAALAGAYQAQAAEIQSKLCELKDGSIKAAKLLDILNAKCENAQNAGHHVDEMASGANHTLDLNVLFMNLQEDNDMMDTLEKYRISIQELRTSIDKLEKESATNYLKMTAL